MVGVFIGGFNDDNAYKELFLTAENLNSSNNVYEEIAEQIVEEIDLTKLSNMDLDLCYWISGKGIAGGIASEVARKVDNSKDIYCYTFASPYTHNEGGSDTNTKIKNIINEDDFLIKSFIEDKAYYRNGEIYNASIKLDYMDKYRGYIGPSSSSYKGDCTKANTIAKQIKREEEGKESVREILLKNLVEKTGKGASAVIISPTTVKINDTTIAINDYNFKDANSYKAYYVLSKVLEGINKKTSNETKYNEIEIYPMSGTDLTDASSLIIDALKKVASWYINNVFTYQGKKAYEDYVKVDREHGTSEHKMYMLGTGAENKIEFLKLAGGTDIVYGGNSEISDKGKATTEEIEVKKKENNKTVYYYFDRKVNDLTKFVYDYVCYIKASVTACEKNHQYMKKKESILNYYVSDDSNPVKAYKYKDLGDDCARFAFAVLELGTGEEAEDLVRLGDDASQFCEDNDKLKDMLKKYFDIYTGDKLIEEYNKGLKNGDMLVTQSSDGIDANRKSGRNHCEFIYNNSVSPIGVYGWGNVKNSLDSRARFSVVENKYIYNSEDGNYYSVLYRKKAGK